jgi:hypothetical protein
VSYFIRLSVFFLLITSDLKAKLGLFFTILKTRQYERK